MGSGSAGGVPVMINAIVPRSPVPATAPPKSKLVSAPPAWSSPRKPTKWPVSFTSGLKTAKIGLPFHIAVKVNLALPGCAVAVQP